MANYINDPTGIGSAILERYYTILRERPEATDRFYRDSGSVLIVDGENTYSAIGWRQIRDLTSITLNFAHIETQTVNSVYSGEHGVIVAISGKVKSRKGTSDWRKFLQIFYLRMEEEGEYFIQNDIFHFINEEVITQPPASGTEQGSLPAVEIPVGDTPQMSYAHVLQSPTRNPRPKAGIQPSSRSRENVARGILSRELGESKHIYVKNLPHHISAIEVRRKFTNYGEVKLASINFCKRTETGDYCLLEYVDVDSARKAVKASPIDFDGRRVYVEFKRQGIGSTSRRGRTEGAAKFNRGRQQYRWH